jgi:hypothetical protein
VFWALGLAVATADPWAGAALMATLVALTTPALAGVAFSPLALAAAPVRWRAVLAAWAGRWLAPGALALSGVVVLGTAVARHYGAMGAICPHCG